MMGAGFDSSQRTTESRPAAMQAFFVWRARDRDEI
jgi:hypothetical protein